MKNTRKKIKLPDLIAGLLLIAVCVWFLASINDIAYNAPNLCEWNLIGLIFN